MVRIKIFCSSLLLFLAPAILAAQAPAGFAKIGNTALVTFADAACPDQTTCYYVVTAVDSTGAESQPSACGTGQLCVNGFEAVAQMPSSGTHTVVLTWTASTTAGVTYNIYVHIGPLPASGLNARVN